MAPEGLNALRFRHATRSLARSAACAVALSLALASAPATAAAQEQPTPGAATPAPSELFLFIYRPGPAWREGVPMRQQGLAPHAAYMQRLLDARRLFAGGGFADDDGGMAIVTAANIEEARTLLAADPAVVGGVFVAEIEHWRPRFRSDAPLPRRK